MGQGQFTAADVDQPKNSSGQTGQFTAADVDQATQSPRGFLARAKDTLIGNEPIKLPDVNIPGAPNTSRQLNEVKSIGEGMLSGLRDVAAPHIAGSLYRAWNGDKSDLQRLPGEAVMTLGPLFAGAGAEVPRGSIAEGMRSAPEAAASETASQSGMLSRAWEVAKRRAGHIPGVQAVKDAGYILGGKSEAPPTPTPQVPPWWGKGQYGTPVDMWGKTVEEQHQTPEQPTIKRGSLSQMLQQQLEKGLDAAPPPKPNVPLRGQLYSGMKPAPDADLPPGHTAIEGSSAVRSAMYDMNANEFHARLHSGDPIYVYGDVSPEEALQFQKAQSKGQAYQALKNNHPLVAKIINGKRMPVKAAQTAQ